MASGKFGLPRPLLNETCHIRIDAHNTGADTLSVLEDIIKSMGGGYEFTIVDSGSKELDGFPETPYVEIENNRIPFEDLSKLSEEFGRRTQPANEDQITISTVTEYEFKRSNIKRPVPKKLKKQGTFVLEVDLKSGIKSKHLKRLKHETDLFNGVYTFRDPKQLIIDTSQVYLTISTLDDFTMSLLNNGIDYSSIVIACGTQQFV